MDGTVLIADDDRSIRIVLTQALTRAGCRVRATGSLSQLMRWVDEGAGDLVITDVMMPDGNGLDLIPAITRARPGLPVIVISAQNSIMTAIRATEAEVFDYLPKPFDLPELLARVRAGLGRRSPHPPAPPAAAAAPAVLDSAALIGATPAMQVLFREVARLVASDLPIVIAAESGAGRSTLARALHMLGERRDGPLVTLPPGAPPEALPARLAEAQGGTLIVEDPAGHDPAAQLRLAALLDAPSPNIPPRLVATTGPDPLADIAAGRLRPELHYRLAGAVLTLPPLRERLDDLPALVRLMLDRAAGQARELAPAALDLLRAHPFPGNLRELDNLLRRLSLTAPAPRIEAAEVSLALAAGKVGPVARPDTAQSLADTVEQHLQRYFDLHGDDLPPPGLYDRIMRETERPLIQIALDACNGNQLRCAELLGMNRNTLRKKIAELDIQVTRRRRVM